jgi:hypothetical protein
MILRPMNNPVINTEWGLRACAQLRNFASPSFSIMQMNELHKFQETATNDLCHLSY